MRTFQQNSKKKTSPSNASSQAVSLKAKALPAVGVVPLVKPLQRMLNPVDNNKALNKRIEAYNKKTQMAYSPAALMIELESIETDANGAIPATNLNDEKKSILNAMMSDLAFEIKNKDLDLQLKLLRKCQDFVEKRKLSWISSDTLLQLEDIRHKLIYKNSATDQPVEQAEIKDGPKAGFEIEWTSLVWIDREEAKPFFDLLVTNEDEAKRELPRAVTASYPKRTTLFTFPGGTILGQADSTILNKPNLEMVTRPLTPEQWKNNTKKDYRAFQQFKAGLDSLPKFKPVSPKELLPELEMHNPSAYLFKKVDFGRDEFQMTKAGPLPDKDEAPEWWLKGMNWDAMGVIKQIATVLKAPSYPGSNPKSAFGDYIPKTPVLYFLKSPYPGQEEKFEQWKQGMLKELAVNPDDMVAKKMVDTSQDIERMNGEKPLHKANMELIHTKFSWRDYLDGLLAGQDRIAEWAKTAFGGKEDIGLEQIPDESLGSQWLIEEHRPLGFEYDAKNYRDVAIEWGEKVTDSLDKEHTCIIEKILTLTTEIKASTLWEIPLTDIPRLELILEIITISVGTDNKPDDTLVTKDTGQLQKHKALLLESIYQQKLPLIKEITRLYSEINMPVENNLQDKTMKELKMALAEAEHANRKHMKQIQSEKEEQQAQEEKIKLIHDIIEIRSFISTDSNNLDLIAPDVKTLIAIKASALDILQNKKTSENSKAN